MNLSEATQLVLQYHQSGQLAQAISAYGQALVYKPDFAEAHNSLGIALRNKGWIDEEYVNLAVALALDLPRLASMRHGLRRRMKDSPLLDAPGFTRKLESAYRQMWQEYCECPR
jgi:tetratricopeptide (TPR) repeat protein